MATARKLPSGSWQTRVTRLVNGQKITKSFTVSPDECHGDSRKAKARSEMLARQWQISVDTSRVYGLTVGAALEKYINDRAKVLSPSTIINYRRLIPCFEPLADIFINDLRKSQIQALINDWSISITTKTIQNRISFLLSALDYSECEKRFKLRYPQNNSKKVTAPDIEDVKMLIDNAPDDFKPILYLAAFGTLRRGEISALKQKDISRDMNTIYVHADMVLSENGYVYKPFTKTGAEGVIQLPKFVIESLPFNDDPESYVFDLNPNMISHRYDVIRKRLKLNYNFHSLRHFAASFRSDLNVPRKYIEEVGRWGKGSSVLDRVYDNTLTSNRKKYTQIVNRYIEEEFEKKEGIS